MWRLVRDLRGEARRLEQNSHMLSTASLQLEQQDMKIVRLVEENEMLLHRIECLESRLKEVRPHPLPSLSHLPRLRLDSQA